MTTSNSTVQLSAVKQTTPLNTSTTDAIDLISEASYQLAFLRSAFVGSEPKELSKIEQHGLCLLFDHVQADIETAAAGLKGE
jgi:hypothetical protein